MEMGCQLKALAALPT